MTLHSAHSLRAGRDTAALLRSFLSWPSSTATQHRVVHTSSTVLRVLSCTRKGSWSSPPPPPNSNGPMFLSREHVPYLISPQSNPCPLKIRPHIEKKVTVSFVHKCVRHRAQLSSRWSWSYAPKRKGATPDPSSPDTPHSLRCNTII
jgi:hypothetical protein